MSFKKKIMKNKKKMNSENFELNWSITMDYERGRISANISATMVGREKF